MNELIEKRIISSNNDSSALKPTEGTKCLITLMNVTYKCDKVPDFTLKFGEATLFHQDRVVNFIIGEVDYNPDRLLEKAVKTMYPKEISDFKLKLYITRNNIIYEVFIDLRLELTDTIQIGFVHEWTPVEKLYIAARHKDRGVGFFTEKKIILAFRRFSKSLKLILSIGDLLLSGLGEEDFKMAVELKRDLYNNLALCRQNMNFQNMKSENMTENSEHIVYLCERVLEIDGNNIKALMRLVKARMELKDYEQALEVTKRILILEPGNSVAQRDIVTLTRIIKQQNQNSDDIVKKMFSNM